MEDKIYVRNTFGDIYKVDDSTEIMYKTDVLYNRIVKETENIIDLIQIGDFVNGKLIHTIKKGQNYCYLYYGICKTFVDYQIEEILTKERYEQNCFKVVE